MLYKIKLFFRWLNWVLAGFPVARYKGYNCGCCGAWVDEDFCIPIYKSAGKEHDTWGLCTKCKDVKTVNIKVRCGVKLCANNDDKNMCKLDVIEIEPMGVMIRWHGLKTEHGRCKMFENKTYRQQDLEGG